MNTPDAAATEPTLTFTTPTTVAILGAGRVGGALATKLAEKGHRLILGVPNPDDASAKWNGPAVTFSDPTSAAQIVINATPGETSLERLSALSAQLDGKVLVDLANASRRGKDSPVGDLCYPGSSLAEKLQQALPNTRVVKTLNTMIFMVMTNPQALRVPPTAFLSGNDPAAKTSVRALLGELGWPAEWTLDLWGYHHRAGSRGAVPVRALHRP